MWIQEIKEGSWKRRESTYGLKAKQCEHGLLWESQDLASLWFSKQRDGAKRVEREKDETCGGRQSRWDGSNYRGRRAQKCNRRLGSRPRHLLLPVTSS